ncbi:endonuclease [uncultured phage_MedDCM-OCT-S28-C10]|uniref:Endonuclease n=1 Tax=uncultured phage_MedDCM-OCT-S28-C10 TaxID=2741077 RepID=A0A6S4P9P1_9CAUD|nr:endonuclease [uncultured phage_MedDCM-OCT-S28-C10]BAQ94082.1 endonuclease [uncultured phage_MedDCM-OCT-S28-C10]BAR25284.1 phage endodeoxyribonuclease I [uncultured Mediterranean phage uvMED]BAR25305.1 phage endodeoxyribonuclease I [uncultured Mediterranean phage uvMED]
MKRAKRQTTLFRSGLEERLADQLTSLGVSYEYETLVVKYVKPEKTHRYTPDFILSNGIIIEGKGRFLTKDRQKHILVKQQNPDLDIRFVFSNPNQRISKISKTTYAKWCTTNGFLYAKQTIPNEWIKERRAKKKKTNK